MFAKQKSNLKKCRIYRFTFLTFEKKLPYIMQAVKILIVENELLISHEISSRLTKAGYHITAQVATAEEAFRSVEEELPDIVIMDIHLDGPVDGIEAALEIKRSHTVHIIFLTDLDNGETLDRAARVEATFLVKPFNERQVAAVIHQAIHNASYALKARPGDAEPPAESHYVLNDCLFIRVDGNHYKKMKLNDITYIEAEGSYAYIHTVKNEKVTYALNMNLIHSRIQHPSFVRVSRFYVVNLDQVDEIKGNLLVVNNKEIQIGENYRLAVKRSFPLLK